jgi:hypothetical protein
MAQATESTTTSRRALLAGAAILPIVTVGIALPALADTNGPDAQLVALAREAIDLNRRYEKATEATDELLDLFDDRAPERPAELKARPTDGGIKHIGFERDKRSDPEHTNRCWIKIDDLEALRTTQQTAGQASWEFIGSEEDWEKLDRSEMGGRDRWEEEDDVGGYQPPAQQRHLWEKKFHPGHQARADEILSAHDRHAAELERLRAEIGLDVAEAHADGLFEQFRRVERQIEKTAAVTIEGIRAKAEVVGRVCWSGMILRGHQTTDRRIIASIMADLTGLPDDRPHNCDPDDEA